MAADVVRALLHDGGYDLLGLGEVMGSDINRLLPAEASTRFGRIVDERRHIIVLYDTAKLRNVRARKLHAFVYEKDLAAGIWAEFEVAGSAVHVVVVHWPSRVIDQVAHRLKCGEAVQSVVQRLSDEEADPAVVVMGDFNDEPFDPSMTMSLQATRDRSAARRSRHLLYNPFWRLLGERDPMEQEVPARGAGTVFRRSARGTNWQTFDQILVSPALLRRHGWTLVENATSILPLELLRSEAGRPRMGFDHYPVGVTLEHHSRTSDADL